MESLAQYLDMGGYARFIWPAYGVVSLVMLALVATTLLSLRARERELASLKAETSSRRGRLPADPQGPA